jgi:outer membrane protein OmpA-like peptidoglycan-associated protein
MRKIFLRIILLFIFSSGVQLSASAQNSPRNGQLLLEPMDVFVPHWQVGGEVGGGYDIGEAKFFDLISPALQFTAAYHINEFAAARLALSGFVSRNCYAFPVEKYKWYFVQPAIDFKFDLASIISGWDPNRMFAPYAFVGVGASISFGNDDAVNATRRWGVDYQKLWDGTRFNPVVRGGLGADFWVSDKTAITFEANANMLPDHYNSKRGRHDNRDWRFNAMVGVRFRLGDHSRKTEPVYARNQPSVVQPVQGAQQQKITRDMTDLTVNVQFVINQSIIRQTEYEKLYDLVAYLNNHPQDHVLLTGYADKETGNAEINERLSRERANAVAAWLRERGVAPYRIHTDHKGDRIQPFDFPFQNRVCVCIVLDAKYF